MGVRLDKTLPFTLLVAVLWRAQSIYCAIFLRYVEVGPKRKAFVRALAITSAAAVAFIILVCGAVPRACPWRGP